MQSASKHLQFSVLAGLVTVFGLTVGFAGAEDAMLPSFVTSFIQVDPNTVTDEGNPFAGAKFDITGYMTHPCYDINGTETDMCTYQYGINTPLKTYIENGSLLSFLKSRGLLMGQMATTFDTSAPTMMQEETTMPQAVTEPADSTRTMTLEPSVTVLNESVDTDADFYNLRLARSNKLWDICVRETESRDAAASCFQRNMQLFMRLNVEINEETVDLGE